MSGEHRITTLEQLEALYGKPSGPAVVKEIDRISDGLSQADRSLALCR